MTVPATATKEATEQKVVQPDAAKAASEAALKAQYAKDANQNAPTPGGAVPPKADEVAAKAAADKAAADKVAADAAAKAEADKKAAESGKSPWDTSKEEEKKEVVKEPTAEEKAKAELEAKAKADADKPYELKVPEGTTVEPAKLKEYADAMKSFGISQESAQKLLERDLATRKANAESSARLAKETDQGWQKQIQAKFGDKFSESSEFVKRGFDDIDPSGKIRAGLKAANIINWPEVVFEMERHGRRIAEDKLFTANAGKTKAKMGPEEALKEQYRKAAQGK